jgi:Leucine-rich repeat (LRR) protein
MRIQGGESWGLSRKDDPIQHLYLCKAHHLSYRIASSFESRSFSFDRKYVDPYGEMVRFLDWKFSDHRHPVPPYLFELFPNLQVLDVCNMAYGNLGNRGNKIQLPPGLGRLRRLQIVCLHNVNMTEMPADIASAASLTKLICTGSPIRELPDWSPGSQLTTLCLSDLYIHKLSPDIGHLERLTHLDLGGCLLNDLPQEMADLKQLKYLRLSG